MTQGKLKKFVLSLLAGHGLANLSSTIRRKQKHTLTALTMIQELSSF